MRDSLIRRNKEFSGLHLLSSANEWWGGYQDASGSLYFQPIAAWAYVDVEYRKPTPDGDRNLIIGVTGRALADQNIRDAADNPEFIGYFRSDQFDIVGLSLKPEFIPSDD